MSTKESPTEGAGEKHDISHSSVKGWKKRREDIESHVEASSSSRVKRQRKKINSKMVKLDDDLFEWFSTIRKRGFPVPNKSLKQKAQDLAHALSIDGFSASSGWLSKFRKDFAIDFQMLDDRMSMAESSIVTQWESTLPQQLAPYQKKDVWNFDETRLAWRTLPSQSLVL